MGYKNDPSRIVNTGENSPAHTQITPGLHRESFISFNTIFRPSLKTTSLLIVKLIWSPNTKTIGAGHCANSQFGPVLPTADPSGHIFASIVQPTFRLFCFKKTGERKTAAKIKDIPTPKIIIKDGVIFIILQSRYALILLMIGFDISCLWNKHCDSALHKIEKLAPGGRIRAKNPRSSYGYSCGFCPSMHPPGIQFFNF